MSYLDYALKKLRNAHIKAHTLLIRNQFRELHSQINPAVTITNPQFVSIGHRVVIRPYTWIYAITNDGEHKNIFSPSIRIEDGCNIGRFCHITCSNELVLEKDAFIMESVLITDSIHGYEDISLPVIKQSLISRGPVVIGSGSWIGNGARIVGSVRIGRNSVVGANAFVSKDVPDYCMVAGLPARIIKRFDANQQQWIRVDEALEWT